MTSKTRRDRTWECTSSSRSTSPTHWRSLSTRPTSQDCTMKASSDISWWLPRKAELHLFTRWRDGCSWTLDLWAWTGLIMLTSTIWPWCPFMMGKDQWCIESRSSPSKCDRSLRLLSDCLYYIRWLRYVLNETNQEGAGGAGSLLTGGSCLLLLNRIFAEFMLYSKKVNSCSMYYSLRMSSCFCMFRSSMNLAEWLAVFTATDCDSFFVSVK